MSELFNIQLETDLSEFDLIVTDGGDLYHSTPGLAGSGGKMGTLIDDANSIYGMMNVSPTSQFRFRFYIDIADVLFANWTSHTVIRISTAGSPYYNGYMVLRKDTGSLYLSFFPHDDSGWLSVSNSTSLTGEHYVEVHIERATTAISADGRIRWWLDGTLLNAWSNIDNYDNFNDISNITIGARENVDATTTGTVWFDEFKANDDGLLIGPYVPPPAIQPATLRRLVHFNYTYLLNLVWGIGASAYTLSEATVQLCLTLLTTFPLWRDYWVGYDGYNWNDDMLEDIVTVAIGELIPD